MEISVLAPSELQGKHELSDVVYIVMHFEHFLKRYSCFSHNMEGCPETILEFSVQMTWVFIIGLNKIMLKVMEIFQIKYSLLCLKVVFSHYRKDW